MNQSSYIKKGKVIIGVSALVVIAGLLFLFFHQRLSIKEYEDIESQLKLKEKELQKVKSELQVTKNSLRGLREQKLKAAVLNKDKLKKQIAVFQKSRETRSRENVRQYPDNGTQTEEQRKSRYIHERTSISSLRNQVAKFNMENNQLKKNYSQLTRQIRAKDNQIRALNKKIRYLNEQLTQKQRGTTH